MGKRDIKKYSDQQQKDKNLQAGFGQYHSRDHRNNQQSPKKIKILDSKNLKK